MIVMKVLENHNVVFVAAFIMFMCVYTEMKKFAVAVKPRARWMVPVMSLVDAWAFMIVNRLCLDRLPTWMMVVTSLGVVLNLMMFTEDTWMARANYFSVFLVTIICVYGIVNAGVFLVQHILYTSDLVALDHVRMCLALLFTALCIFSFVHSKFYTVNQVSEFLHDKSRSLLLLIYSLCGGLVLSVSDASVVNLVYNQEISFELVVAASVNLFLKNNLILFSVFLILIFLVRQFVAQKMNDSLDAELLQERRFRESRNQEKIFNFRASVTRDCLVEGMDQVSPDIYRPGRSYEEMLQMFAEYCVHPEDRRQIMETGSVEFHLEMLEKCPSFSMPLRVNHRELQKFLILGQRQKELMERTQGEWIWIEFQVTITQSPLTGEIWEYISVENINDKVIEQSELSKAARTDSLTGAYNRATLEKHIRATLHREQTGAMFMVDIDHFKEINDTLGHQAGDEQLCRVVETLKGLFRDKDIIGRLGGDEFCVFATEFDDESLIRQRAECLNRQGRQILTAKDGREVLLSLSVGIAVAPEGGDTYEELYKNADLALYEAKESGRDTYRLYVPPEA